MKTRRHLNVFAQYFIRNLFFKEVTDADKKFGLVKSLFDDIEKCYFALYAPHYC